MDIRKSTTHPAPQTGSSRGPPNSSDISDRGLSGMYRAKQASRTHEIFVSESTYGYCYQNIYSDRPRLPNVPRNSLISHEKGTLSSQCIVLSIYISLYHLHSPRQIAVYTSPDTSGTAISSKDGYAVQ